jgi:hypothetical protein
MNNLSVYEIVDHIETVGYVSHTVELIKAYLLGKGIINERAEIVVEKFGNHDFNHFVKWFETNSEKDIYDKVITFVDEQDESLEVEVSVGTIVATLIDLGFDITCQGYVAENEHEVRNHSVIISGLNVNTKDIDTIVACPDCVADELRQLGYHVTKPE